MHMPRALGIHAGHQCTQLALLLFGAESTDGASVQCACLELQACTLDQERPEPSLHAGSSEHAHWAEPDSAPKKSTLLHFGGEHTGVQCACLELQECVMASGCSFRACRSALSAEKVHLEHLRDAEMFLFYPVLLFCNPGKSAGRRSGGERVEARVGIPCLG